MLLIIQSDLNIGAIIVGLAGGLALFLFGLELMTEQLKKAAGERMRQLLQRLTSNRFTAVCTGIAVTSIIQSSSVTTVLVIGFISAGIMSLSQSIGVIMGANIGTTITAQIIAFKITKYALLLLASGYFLYFCGKKEKIRSLGGIIMALGLIFLGMDLMSQATYPLRSYEPFIEAMRSMRNPLVGIAISAAFTGLVQSSSATTGIVIVMASQGFISLETGIVLTLGANIGTCITALLAAIGKSREALQAAAVHVFFNFSGALLWIGFVDIFADIVRSFSNSEEGLTGMAKMAAETPRQIANAHSMFNIINALIFIGFTGHIARLAERFIPLERDQLKRETHLDKEFLETPSLAVDCLRREVVSLGDLVDMSLSGILWDNRYDDESNDSRRRNLRQCEQVYQDVTLYAQRISMQTISEKTSSLLSSYLEIANNLKNISDVLSLNLMPVLEEWHELDYEASEETLKDLSNLYKRLRRALEDVLRSLEEESIEEALKVIDMKDSFNQRSDRLLQDLNMRLVSKTGGDVRLYQLEVSTVETVRRIFYLIKNIAKLEAGVSDKNDI